MITPPPAILAAILAAATATNSSPDLLQAIAWTESRYNHLAESSTGAQGLFQISRVTGKVYGLTKPFEARANAEVAARLLQDLRRRYPLHVALAAYNWGSGNIRRRGHHPDNWPASVRAYVKKIYRLQRHRAPF